MASRVIKRAGKKQTPLVCVYKLKTFLISFSFTPHHKPRKENNNQTGFSFLSRLLIACVRERKDVNENGRTLPNSLMQMRIPQTKIKPFLCSSINYIPLFQIKHKHNNTKLFCHAYIISFLYSHNLSQQQKGSHQNCHRLVNETLG